LWVYREGVAVSDDEKDQEGTGGGNFYFMLRFWAGDHTQSDFADRTGIPPSEINRFEKGRKKPRAATFKKMLKGAGVPERLLDSLLWSYDLLRKARTTAGRIALPPSQSIPSADLKAAALEVLARNLALARSTCQLRHLQEPGAPTEQQVGGLFEKFKAFPPADQRLLLAESSAYREPRLCLRFCHESERAAADDTQVALSLAETARLVARNLPEALRPRAEAWSLGFIGNVQRVIGGDFEAAERSFAQAGRLWRSGEDSAGLFSEAYLLDMEASLRRAQRRFPQAHRLHDQALALAGPDERGAILINRAVTYQHQCKHEEALQALAEAAEAIDGERQPRLLHCALFNRASNLLLLGRTAEAEPLVPEVRSLADRLDNGIDLIRATWLEANCAAGLGRREDALSKLAKVREGFAGKSLPFDYALAGLDEAVLYREEGRFQEIQHLAAEILAFFQAQQVHRETIAAFLLLQEAAEQEKVTAGLLERLKTYLSEARRRPGVRFGG
jgi:transcriptional regulator with XRE-family HTH domain